MTHQKPVQGAINHKACDVMRWRCARDQTETWWCSRPHSPSRPECRAHDSHPRQAPPRGRWSSVPWRLPYLALSPSLCPPAARAQPPGRSSGRGLRTSVRSRRFGTAGGRAVCRFRSAPALRRNSGLRAWLVPGPCGALCSWFPTVPCGDQTARDQKTKSSLEQCSTFKTDTKITFYHCEDTMEATRPDDNGGRGMGRACYRTPPPPLPRLPQLGTVLKMRVTSRARQYVNSYTK